MPVLHVDDLRLGAGDALLVTDVQNDFLPGGALGVERGDEVVAPLVHAVHRFRAAGLPIAFSRCWHPPNHCSFQAQGGLWPPHCVQGTRGARFARGLVLPPSALVISKGTDPAREAYSAFSGTRLAGRLEEAGVRHLFVGGLTTEYCVQASVRDALALGLTVSLLIDGIRAVDRRPGDGVAAIEAMLRDGALPMAAGPHGAAHAAHRPL